MSSCEGRDGGRPKVPNLIEVFVFVVLVGKIEEELFPLLPKAWETRVASSTGPLLTDCCGSIDAPNGTASVADPRLGDF